MINQADEVLQEQLGKISKFAPTQAAAKDGNTQS